MTSSQQLTVAEAFSEAVIHDRHVILGREMQPFCLDHWLILSEVASPLIHGGPVKIEDMQLAIKACSTGNSIEFYDAALRPAFGWTLWGQITRCFPVGPLLKAFNSYIDDYFPKMPRWGGLDEEGDETKCPSLFIAGSKWIEAGHAPEKVRRMALGEMIAWNLASAEAKGDPLKSIKSRVEIEAEREIAAEEAARV